MSRAWWVIGGASLACFVACGGSSEDNLFQPTGGRSGAGGGSSGKAGSTAGGSAGAAAGTGGTSSGGTSAGGSGGTSTGGTSSGGSAGKGGTSSGGTSSGGAAGASGCAGGCDDGVGCTIDSCVEGSCVHVPGTCPSGQYCDVKAGCSQAPTCANDDACKALWGTDACKANVRCDGATATCKFDLLDKDGDLHWPVVCGGDDCDDVDPNKHPGRPEVCDGKDNDCDGSIDDGNLCTAPRVCMAGGCACPAANQCGGECVDKSTNPNHCGGCGIKCPAAATCTNGVCDCPGDSTACGNSCIDTKVSQQHCGGCNKPCNAQQKCVGGACACSKKQCGVTCVDPDVDLQNCGDCGIKCPLGATCNLGLCACPASKPDTCLGACVDKQSDPKNCGDCGVDCAGAACVAGKCSTCTQGGLLILLDQSGSMSTTLGASTRLTQMIEAVKAFVQEPESTGLSVGVTFYPRGTSASSCIATDYATPNAAIAPLPANAGAILTAVTGKAATGNSVLNAPLSAAIDNVRAWGTANPGAPGAVVLINDGGAGNGCPGEIPLAVTTAMTGLGGSPSVPTYVIGLGAPSATELQTWTDVANAGGGTMTNTGASGMAAIVDALRAVRAKHMCP